MLKNHFSAFKSIKGEYQFLISFTSHFHDPIRKERLCDAEIKTQRHWSVTSQSKLIMQMQCEVYLFRLARLLTKSIPDVCCYLNFLFKSYIPERNLHTFPFIFFFYIWINYDNVKSLTGISSDLKMHSE